MSVDVASGQFGLMGGAPTICSTKKNSKCLTFEESKLKC